MTKSELIRALKASAESGDREAQVMLPVVEGWLRAAETSSNSRQPPE